MEAKNLDKQSAGKKLLSVILGTLMGGFMWRCRGESGFGSSWGLYSVALILLLLIWNFYGKRSGMKIEKIGIGALLAGLGVTGYATVIEQLAGVVYSDLPYQGQEVYLPVNKYSGLVIILIMGFTLVPLFSWFTASLFSEKKYKIKDYLLMICVFFGVSYICKASVSHFIMGAINPDQVKYAALGLADSGLDYGSPMRAYLAHFGSRSWCAEIPFFENYYMSIEHISDAIATLTILIYPLIAFKDKVTCFVSFAINLTVSLSATAFSSFIAVHHLSGFFEGASIPAFLSGGSGWGLWEFTVGAALGFIVMLCISLLPVKYKAPSGEDTSPLFEKKTGNTVFNSLLWSFVLGVVPGRAAGIRIAKLLANEGLLRDDEPLGTILTVCFSVILAAVIILKIRKNVYSLNKTPLGTEPVKFSFNVLPLYFLFCAVLYFFTNRGYLLHLPYGTSDSIGHFLSEMISPGYNLISLMLFTFCLTAVIYIPFRSKSMDSLKCIFIHFDTRMHQF